MPATIKSHPHWFVEDAEFSDGVRIVLDPPRQWILIAFLSTWIYFWAHAEFTMLSRLRGQHWLADHDRPLKLSLLIWTTFGILAVLRNAWELFGRERIHRDKATVTFICELWRLRSTRSFVLADMLNLRYGPVKPSLFSRDRAIDTFGWTGECKGNVAFSYRGRLHRFGDGLSETDANGLIDAIQGRTTKQQGLAEMLP